jgi:hypothetical protein
VWVLTMTQTTSLAVWQEGYRNGGILHVLSDARARSARCGVYDEAGSVDIRGRLISIGRIIQAMEMLAPRWAQRGRADPP